MSKAQEFRDYLRMRPHMHLETVKGQVATHIDIRMTDDGGLEITREWPNAPIGTMPYFPVTIAFSPEQTDVLARWFEDTFGDEPR